MKQLWGQVLSSQRRCGLLCAGSSQGGSRTFCNPAILLHCGLQIWLGKSTDCTEFIMQLTVVIVHVWDSQSPGLRPPQLGIALLQTNQPQASHCEEYRTALPSRRAFVITAVAEVRVCAMLWQCSSMQQQRAMAMQQHATTERSGKKNVETNLDQVHDSTARGEHQQQQQHPLSHPKLLPSKSLRQGHKRPVPSRPEASTDWGKTENKMQKLASPCPPDPPATSLTLRSAERNPSQ